MPEPESKFRAVTRGLAVTAAGVLVATTVVTGDVSADPTTADAALKLYQDLSEKASATNEAALAAQIDYDTKVADRKAAESKVSAAKAEVVKWDTRREQLQPTIDAVVRANYMGGRTNRMYALLVSDSPQQMLDQMATLAFVNRDVLATVKEFKAARVDAEAATKRAQSAEADADAAAEAAAATRTELTEKKTRLAGEVERIKALFDRLTGRQRDALQSDGVKIDPATLPKGGGEAAAVRAAVSKTGSPYGWGATGPSRFDCSGLMVWAYKQVGKSIPRTSQAQMNGGQHVSRGQLQPGDLIIYYPGATHVGMYIGDGKVVHASTYGVPVQVVPIDGAGPYNTAVRY